MAFATITGCHAGAGPVVACRVHEGARVGWEASGGWTIARGAVGQTFSLAEGKHTLLHAAWECAT